MKPSILALCAAMAATALAACQPAAPTHDTGAPAAQAAAPATPAPAAQSAPVQAELASEINAQIDALGAGPTLAALQQDPTRSAWVGSAIATGDPLWMTIALRLAQGNGRQPNTWLARAAANALPNAPERTLALVGHGYRLQDVCMASPFESPGAGQAEAYVARTLAALKSVSDPALKPGVDACVALVGAGRT